MGKQKHRNFQKHRKTSRLYLLIPISAFLILTLPSVLVIELVNYLFADKLYYPLAYISMRTDLHIVIGIGLLISWIAIRLIVFRKFIRVFLFSVLLLIIALAVMSLDVTLFKTLDEIAITSKHYYLRQATIHDYSSKWSFEPNGSYTFVHKCDSMGIQCETVFLERRVPLPSVNRNHPTFLIDNDQLLLVYLIPDTNEIETIWAVIEENLE